MKIVIVGCGRCGRKIANQLSNEGHDVSIIDRNPIAFDSIMNNSLIKMVIGTGIDCDVLESAGIKDADTVIAITKGDNTNIMIAQIAQNLYKVPRVITRIVDPKVKEFYRTEIGLTCYCPTDVNSEHYLGMIKGDAKICISL